ncbi:hypothetical protein G6734_08725, partial [Polynucleobacter paneuropaeus]|nr:hypothetical protein [Polynucleobacter paneuropaeus]
GQVTAIGGTGQDTYAFYGSKAGLQVDLTIEHFKAGDKIDISHLLGNTMTELDFTTALSSALSQQYIDESGQLQIDLSGLTSDSYANILLQVDESTLSSTYGLNFSDFITSTTQSWFTQAQPLIINAGDQIITITLDGNYLYNGNLYSGTDPIPEVFLGSSGDDRAIGNNGHDVFKDFNAGDSFVGNAQTTIQIAQ